MKNQKQTIRKMISFLNNADEDGGFWLPNIQRPFVWREEQICRLFDSILREYPISTLLVWKTTSRIRRRKFIDNWKDTLRLSDFYVPEDTKKKNLVLDGQQRLQSLFIGLYGSFDRRELYLDSIRLPGAGLIFSSGNGRKWTEPSGKLLHDEVVPAQICRHRSVGLCGCEEAGNEGHEGRLAGRRTCAEHVAVESAHGRLAVPLSPRQLVGASSAATVGPAGSLAGRWVWRLPRRTPVPAAARDHAGPGDGAAAMRTRGGDRRREQRRAAWWRARRWRRNPRVAGSGGGGTARIECGPGARRRTGSG